MKSTTMKGVQIFTKILKKTKQKVVIKSRIMKGCQIFTKILLLYSQLNILKMENIFMNLLHVNVVLKLNQYFMYRTRIMIIDL